MPRDSVKEAGAALVRVLKDEAYRRELQGRSRLVQGKYFSWEAVGAAYAGALREKHRAGET